MLAGLALVLFASSGFLTMLLLAGELGSAAGLVTGLVLATLPAPVYLYLGLWIDRYEPEPPRLLAWAFLWGATGATLIALVVNTTGQAVVGGAFGAAVGQLYGGSLSAPFVEEIAKAAVLYAIYRWRRHEFDGVLDGIVYAGMVGLGFAFTENVLYYGRTALEGGDVLAATFFVRGVMAPFAHHRFTSLTGLGLGLAALREGAPWRVAPVVGLIGAMVLHSLWNTSAGLAGGVGFLGVYASVMVPVFLALLGVVIAAMVRERHVLERYLTPEVAVGVLGPRRWRRSPRRVRAGGRSAPRARTEPPRVGRDGSSITPRSSSPSCAATVVGARGAPSRTLAELEASYVARLRERRGAADAPALAIGETAHRSSATAGAGTAARDAGDAQPSTAPPPPAGWYRDPYAVAPLRWWDGGRWTEHTTA